MQIAQIGKELLKNEKFISQLKITLMCSEQFLQKGQIKRKINISLDSIISQLSSLLSQLVKQKLQLQIKEMIEENNRILTEIRQITFENHKGFCKQRQRNYIMSQEMILNQDNDDGFSDIHRLIAQQKNKAMGQLNDQLLQKSISAMVEFKCENLEEKLYSMQKKLKALEQKFDTNMKSVWNVISMTQAVVFDYMKNEKNFKKENKTSDEKLKINNKYKNQKEVNNFNKSERFSFSNFWK